jgi:hypothetical protein
VTNCDLLFSLLASYQITWFIKVSYQAPIKELEDGLGDQRSMMSGISGCQASQSSSEGSAWHTTFYSTKLSASLEL